MSQQPHPGWPRVDQIYHTVPLREGAATRRRTSAKREAAAIGAVQFPRNIAAISNKCAISRFC